MNDNPVERLDAALNHDQNALPDSDAELGNLLRVAALIRAHAVPARPSEDGVRRGRARLMAELVAQRRLARSPHDGWIHWFSTLLLPALRPRRVAAVLSAVMLIVVSTRVLSASAESLPGDPLYELKRIQEQVTLSLTLGDQARASLREQYTQERARELLQVQQEHRVTRTQMDGRVERVDENSVTVSGVSMHLDRAALGDLAWLLPGVGVSVLVQSNADGSLEAISINAITQAPTAGQSSPLEATATPRPAETPSPVGAPRATPEPSRIPAAPTPDDSTRVPDATPSAGKTVEPSHTSGPTPKPGATRTDDGTATPDSTRGPDPTREIEPSQTPRPTSTPGATGAPEPTDTRQPTRAPEPTQTDDATSAPTATRLPEPTDTRQPTQTPRPTQTPQPTEKPTATQTDNPPQSPTQTPGPTETKQPDEATQTPQPTRTQVPATATRTPEPSRTDAPLR